ncbi:c-type cytochrome biogenesis protein CcsB [Roseofilum casamattae]|uniref:Cytochrome c biogenesis protein CcsA n=1 Tax=Roseofilum casamattae BLCC-M143 TaxID=3022442 RepID=A0ABT7BYY5_9CYAN|nr:c-type cytochrome biogenesis protein CcsB [Roseofilum casamattae]MDJ1184408.1 c-type cytochrome biogenesis protein CcsB [Roseofilum casamattae BLCC-M143]
MDLVTLQNSLDNLSFAILFVTMLVYWSGMAFPQIPYLNVLGTAGMAIANLCIASLLGARWLEAGYFPLSNLYESLFFIAWGLTAVHLFAEYTSRSRWVGAVTSPAAMGVTAFAALSLPAQMQVSEPLVPALKSNWLMMHVSVMLLSYACLMVGSLLAIAFLIVTRGQAISLTGSSYGSNLRRQTPIPTVSAATASEISLNGNTTAAQSATLERLTLETATTWSPETLSLAQILDNISYRTIGLGFPLLTIGIISGGVWANEAWGSYWSWDPKETWALIVWLVFAAYLHARITKSWQGRRPAILAAGGFVVVWICYMGVNLLGKGLHSYGWFF